MWSPITKPYRADTIRLRVTSAHMKFVGSAVCGASHSPIILTQYSTAIAPEFLRYFT